MKITNKISLSFFVTAIILTTAASSFVYNIEKRNMKDAIFAHLSTTAKSRVSHIETFLTVNKEAIKQLSQSITIKRLLLTSKEDKDYEQRLNDVTRRLKDIVKIAEYFYSFFVLDKDGIVVASNKEADIGKDKSADFYFLGAKEGPFIKDAYVSRHTKRNSLAFSAPLVNDKTGELLGVVAARSDLDGLNKITTDRIGLGETGKIYLVNKYGYMLTPSRFMKGTFLKLKVDSENVRKAFADVEEFGAKLHEHEALIYSDYRGSTVLGIHDHIPEMQWVLLAEIDEQEALVPLNKLKTVVAAILLFIPILAWLIGAGISMLIVGPIYRLHKGTGIIGSGNLDYKVGTDAKDEVGELSRAFDRMAGNLKETVVSKDYVDNIIGSMTDALVVATAKGEIRTVNKAACELLGYNEEELIGKDISLLFPEEERIPFKGAKLEKLIRKSVLSALKGYEINYKTKDGRIIPVLLSGAVMKAVDCSHKGPTEDCPVYREKGKHCEKILGIVCVAKDITERKRAEQRLETAYAELKETQAQLIQSEKMASIGQLAAGAAHEINNPLTVISGEAEMLLKHKDKNRDTKKASKVMVEQAERIRAITERLLEFSRKKKFKLEPLDINDVLKESISLLSYQPKTENIEIIKKLDINLPKVLGDKNQLQEVFLNIMLNAIQAMEEKKGLTITIRTEKIAEYGRRNTDILKQGQEIVVIEFKDTGKGMDEETLKKIFDPFFTTKEKNTGLGLSICYGIIKNHNGTIEAHSKLKEGSAFIVKLPTGGGR